MDWIETFLLLAGFALGWGSCWLWLDLLRRRKEERERALTGLFSDIFQELDAELKSRPKRKR